MEIDISKKFEIYKMCDEQVKAEIKEMYVIHGIFLGINGALFAALTTTLKKPLTVNIIQIAIILLGFIMSIIWFRSIKAQEKWKERWRYRILKIEKKIINKYYLRIWNRVLKEDGKLVGYGLTKCFKWLSILFICSWPILLVLLLTSLKI